jgi:hypothetical protein
MFTSRIKPYKFNNIINENPLKERDIQLHDLQVIYDKYKDVFESNNFQVLREGNLKSVYLKMLSFLIKQNVCDEFDESEFYLVEITHAPNKYFGYAKIDLYKVFKLRKDKKIFNVLVYLINIISEHIALLGDNENIDPGYSFIDISGDYDCQKEFFNDCPRSYFANKEYNKLIVPFVKYIKSFDKIYSNAQVLESLKDYPYWKSFAEKCFEFLQDSSKIDDYCHRYDDCENEEINNGSQCYSYYGFSWDAGNSNFDKSLVDHYDAYAREYAELSPLLITSFDKPIFHKKKIKNKLKKLYKLLSHDN